MASLDQEYEYDPQPDLDVDSWISSLESDSDFAHTPMTPDESEDVSCQSSLAATPMEVESELDSPSSIDLDIKPLAIRRCRATRSRIPKRDPTPESSSDESDISEYELSPKIRPIRHRQMQGTSEERSVSSPLVDIKSEPVSPSSSHRAAGFTRRNSKSKPKPRPKAKRGGGGRKGEPRRTQNMVAQKKYRDKRVNAAHLMSDTIVELRIALRSTAKSTHTGCLAVIQDVLIRYQTKISELDQNLATRQALAVSDGFVKEEQ